MNTIILKVYMADWYTLDEPTKSTSSTENVNSYSFTLTCSDKINSYSNLNSIRIHYSLCIKSVIARNMETDTYLRSMFELLMYTTVTVM